MIRILTKQQDGKLSHYSQLDQQARENIIWHWTDISEPTDSEEDQAANSLPVALHQKEDKQLKRRPQIKLFHDYFLLTIMAVSPNTLKAHEIRLFVGHNFLISHHHDNLKAVNDVWHECRTEDSKLTDDETPTEILHRLIDRLIEQYYMTANLLEDKIDNLDRNSKRESIGQLNRRVFQIRSELLTFRRVVSPLQDIVQRMIGSSSIETSDEETLFLRNINEALARIVHLIESNMEITSDIRDSYLSLTSYRTNSIMQTLTVITTIFMPLSFIAGIYGMNFRYMPELKWHDGYFIVLILMMGIAISMYFWFRKKGWFRD
ncbi:MAG: magnesium/cobalt transporter CorA [Sporolactobacillus sp.]